MAKSLLAHMYSHIRGSQEDIATYSLEYIIGQSSEMNSAFTSLLMISLHADFDREIRYSCQSVGKNQERPDISGVSEDGKEVVLCEAKFYAGLTGNQPGAYLDRLKEEDGVGLVFICPAERRRILWSKLIELCAHRNIETVDEYCVSIDGIKMSIISWSEVIDKLRLTAAAVVQSALSDIEQLDGFCKAIDEDAFIPFSEEDLGPERARLEERNYIVPDAVVNHLLADKALDASTSGLRATPYRHGYARYIRVLGHAISVNYDRPNWNDSSTKDTPFWTVIYEPGFKQPDEYQKAFKKYPPSYRGSINNAIALPLFVATASTLDEIAKNMVSQIIGYIKEIDDTVN